MQIAWGLFALDPTRVAGNPSVNQGPSGHTLTTGQYLVGATHDEGLADTRSGMAAWSGRPFGAQGTSAAAGRFLDLWSRESAPPLQTLSGHFALIAHHRGLRASVAASDRLGTFPLFYHVGPDCLAVATHLRTLTELLGKAPELDTQAVYDYLYFHMIPSPGTIYRNVRRLLPGQALVVSDGKVGVVDYWRPAYETNRSLSRREAANRFREGLRESVARHRGGRDAGTFLSGGTDSTSVTGVLGETGVKPVRAFSIGFDEPGYDEMDYARIAARFHQAEHHEYYVSADDVAEAVPLLAQSLDQPFGNSSIVPAYYCARLARDHGVQVLLGGDGGDELFGGNSRYQTQLLLALYEHLPAPLRRSLIEPVTDRLPRVSLLGKLRSYVEQARVPMPERLETYNLLRRVGARAVLTDEFLADVDEANPDRLLRDAYDRISAAHIVDRMLGIDLKITLADNDLIKVREACALAGVDASFPMLDDTLLDLSLLLRPEWKVTHRRLRPFFKDSLRDVLPPEIIAKKKHGFGLPFGEWLARHGSLNELGKASLEGLAERGIIRESFADALIGKLLYEHPGYYGTLVWILMILGQWLVRHDALALGQGRQRSAVPNRG